MSTLTLNEDSKLSFWEVGGYKPNIRRIRSGAKQLDDFTQMVKERSEIEQKYGKSLQNWHAKWASHVDTHVPQSVMKEFWLKLLTEGRELSQTHSSVKDRFNDELVKTLTLFCKENYHHSALRGIREAKDLDSEFEKAQRQWKKLTEKADTAKKAYYLACRNEKSAQIQLLNLRGDASTASENADKTQERHEKCREIVEKTRKIYQSTLSEIRQFNPVYTENMTFVFEKCQQLELKRLRFAMEMLSGFENVLSDLINPLKLTQLHSSMQKDFKNMSDAQLNDDLREWSKTYGVEAPLTCPLYEEYTPELRKIANSPSLKRSNDSNSTGVVLTKQIITSNELHGSSSVMGSISSHKTFNQYPAQRNSLIETNSLKNRPDSTISDNNSMKLRGPTKIYNYAPSLSQQIAMSNDLNTTVTTKNHHKERLQHENWNENHPEIMPYSTQQKLHSESLSQKSHSDSGTSDIGVDSNGTQFRGTAKVLYNYMPIEGDEIPLTKDEIVEVISGPDNLGWNFGRKQNGVEGLFPGSYVQPI